MKQFEINGGVKKAINDYLLAHGTDLKTAMDSESANGEIAAMKKDGRLKAAYEKTLLPVYGEKVKPEALLAE